MKHCRSYTEVLRLVFVVIGCLAISGLLSNVCVAAEGGATTFQLQAKGTWITVSRKASNLVDVYRPASLTVGKGALPRHSFRLDFRFSNVISADGRVLAGIRKLNGGADLELVLFDLKTGGQKAAVVLPPDLQPTGIWIDGVGNAVGVWGQSRFIAFSFNEQSKPFKAFDRVAPGTVLASSSGNFILFVTDTGELTILQTNNWISHSAVSLKIESGLRAWLLESGFRRELPATEGPFVFPVTPLEISTDDRLLSIGMGENANAFLNMCMATGKVESSVVLGKRVNVKANFSQSGQFFALQVTPNSIEPDYQVPRDSLGYRIYSSYGGELRQTLPIKNSDWPPGGGLNATYFLDEWVGWLGFSAEDKTVLRIENRPATKLIERPRLRATAVKLPLGTELTCPVLLAK